MPDVFALQGRPQSYAWGGRHYIADLVGEPDGTLLAEWWLGAHEKAPSLLEEGGARRPLNEAIAQRPDELLGQAVASRFGRLPYLLKVLDVAGMLSIQVHPDKRQAEAGFSAERARGVPASERIYQDDNHKPEMMVALSPFYLLHGFRGAADAAERLSRHAELRDLAAAAHEGGVESLYRRLMRLPGEEIARRLRPVLQRLEAGTPPRPAEPEYWLLAAAHAYPGLTDPGLFAFFVLNLMVMQPGEAVFQGARLPHAYLRGQNIELMASSDNVLRGGLTPKRVAVDELLKVLDYAPVTPTPLVPQRVDERVVAFPSPVPDFRLDEITLPAGGSIALEATGPEILLSLAGHAEAGGVALARGGSVFLAPGARVRLTAREATRVFRSAANL